jgi:hypothetical protein
MKKLITLILVLSAWNSFAQLTLVKETDNELQPFMLSNGDWMLVSDIYVNNKLKSITFYKSDFSVYKTINISQKFPYDTTGYNYNYISLGEINVMNGIDNEYEYTDKFFNSDEKIELILEYRSQSNKNMSISDQGVSILMNEDGQEIQRFTNLQSQSIDFYFWKFLSVLFENQKNYDQSTTKIYSVPGNLPCPFTCSQKAVGIAPITQPNEFKEIQVNGFPNPSSDKVTLAYALPEGVAFGTLRLYTQTGEMVKEFKVSSQVDHLELPVSEYTPGTYYYELQAGGNTSGGKKMVVIH